MQDHCKSVNILIYLWNQSLLYVKSDMCMQFSGLSVLVVDIPVLAEVCPSLWSAEQLGETLQVFYSIWLKLPQCLGSRCILEADNRNLLFLLNSSQNYYIYPHRPHVQTWVMKVVWLWAPWPGPQIWRCLWLKTLCCGVTASWKGCSRLSGKTLILSGIYFWRISSKAPEQNQNRVSLFPACSASSGHLLWSSSSDIAADVFSLLRWKEFGWSFTSSKLWSYLSCSL